MKREEIWRLYNKETCRSVTENNKDTYEYVRWLEDRYVKLVKIVNSLSNEYDDGM